ncbi:MAG: divergent polysaccharide deacetylase family protein [Rickettsiales bacterium]
MALKLNFIKNINTQLAVLTTCLFLCLLFLIGYITLFKQNHTVEQAHLKKQQISLSIDNDDTAPVIAIIIEAIGLYKTNIMNDLPAEITVGIPSYLLLDPAFDSKMLKHNLAINIPLDFSNSNESTSNPMALHSEDNELTSLIKLDKIFSRSQNIKTVYTHNNEGFTASDKNSSLLLNYLKDRDMVFLSGIINQNANIYDIAKQMNYFIIKNDLALDNILSYDAIKDNLLKLENIAKNKGYATAIGSSYPLTLEALADWTKNLSDKGIRLVNILDFDKIIKKRKNSLSNQNFYFQRESDTK